jgi:hypothetical protein
MPRKKPAKPKLSDKEQSERFKKAARQVGVDQSGEEFEKKNFHQGCTVDKAVVVVGAGAGRC